MPKLADATVITKGLYVHSRRPNGPKIDALKKGDRVAIHDYASTATVTWARVHYGDLGGWVSAACLAVDQPAPPDVPTPCPPRPDAFPRPFPLPRFDPPFRNLWDFALAFAVALPFIALICWGISKIVG